MFLIGEIRLRGASHLEILHAREAGFGIGLQVVGNPLLADPAVHPLPDHHRLRLLRRILEGGDQIQLRARRAVIQRDTQNTEHQAG